MFADFEQHASVIGKDRLKFSVTSDTYLIGNSGCFSDGPTTANWQKTIGAHDVWVSADVTASALRGEIYYDADIVIHMEDRYNFNPHMVDTQTGIPDSAMADLRSLGLHINTTILGHRSVI